MEYKICTKCGIPKLLKEFSPNKRCKDGKRSLCKKCSNLETKERMKKYPWKRTFFDSRTRCNNPKNPYYKNYGGRNIKHLITMKELKELWFRDKAYLMDKPSIDREDNDGHYIFDNCRYIELIDNVARQNVSYKEKPVNQYSLEGNFIRSWKSQAEIQRILGFAQGSISNVCTGKAEKAHNFIWKFREEKD